MTPIVHLRRALRHSEYCAHAPTCVRVIIHIMKTNQKLIELSKHSSHNEIEILQSKNCSCYFCRQTYSARDVNDWTNDKGGVTAICPVCGMDAVIGDACGIPLDKTTLKEMNMAFYGEDYMEKHPQAALKYVERYKQGNITHKKVNENLYIQYLSLLAGLGNPEAAYDLGSLYEEGTEFTKSDAKEAFSYYAMNCLSSDGGALTRLGILSESGALGKVDERGAYECYAKGMAMGSLDALVHFADCYLNGVFVEKNLYFAYDILSSVWPDCYTRFVASSGKDINIFPDVAFRLASFYLAGDKVAKDPRTGLRFLLLADFGYQIMKTSGLATDDILSDMKEAEAEIEELKKKFRLTRQDPIFDDDTFADSVDELVLSPMPIISGKASVSSISYDKESHDCSFDLTFPSPLLIVDIGNLFCGFVPGTIHWDFLEVGDVRIGHGAQFSRITGNPDDGWDFLSYDEGEAQPVFSLILDRPSAHHSSRKAKGGKA